MGLYKKQIGRERICKEQSYSFSQHCGEEENYHFDGGEAEEEAIGEREEGGPTKAAFHGEWQTREKFLCELVA